MARLMDRWLGFILRSGKQKSRISKKVFGLAIGTVFFAFCWPLLLLWVIGYVIPHGLVMLPRMLEIAIGLVAALLGIFFLSWSAWAQWMYGKGTPAYFAPTQKLVILGPYRLCRNPMELGGVLYYLGILTFFASLLTGVLGAFFTFVLGTAYHRFVEEKELAVRFGKEYEDYKRRTPFLIPRFWK